MIENMLFCFAFALQIFAWVLAGASIGFGSRRSFRKAGARQQGQAEKRRPRYNTLVLRRVYLSVGAAVVCVFAVLCRDYILLAGQLVLFGVLWFRVGLEPHADK